MKMNGGGFSPDFKRERLGCGSGGGGGSGGGYLLDI